MSRSAQIPGGDYVIETGARTAQIPGSDYLIETQATGSVALTNVSATFALTSLTPAISVGLTNLSATFTQGNLAPSVTIPLTNVTATFSQGTVTPSNSGTSVALTGISATFSQGTLPPSSSIPLTGVSATFSQGTITAGASAITVPLTGVSASFSLGTILAFGGIRTQSTTLNPKFNKPPVNTQADTIAFKGWFSEAYKYITSGVMVPNGGNVLTPTSSSRRNLIVNGDMMINQRFPTPGTVVTSNGSSIQWALDRWGVAGVGVGIQTVSQQLMGTSSSFPTPGFQYFAQIGATAGNTLSGLVYLAQAIESKKIQELAGLPVTLSFWACCGSAFGSTYWANQTFNNTTGEVMAVIQTGTGIDEGTYAAYTGSFYLPSLGFTPTPYWQHFSVTGTIPTNAQELKVYFQLNKTAAPFNANAWLGITGVQLEVGTQATAFDKIAFDESLIECQRFYEKSFDYAIAPAQNTGNTKGAIGFCVVAHTVAANASVYVGFKVRKAKDPTITFYCPKAATSAWWNETQNVTAGGSSSVDVGEYGFIAQELQISGEAVGNLLDIHFDATADI